MRLRRWIVSLVPALALGACASNVELERLVRLYDVMDPAGTLEIELERDGTVLEMEAEIPIASLPETVRAAALRRLPGAEITGAEIEYHAGGELWEVKLEHDDRGWEFIFDAYGNLMESEQELRPDEAPPAVLSAAEAALPGSEFKSVERIESGDRVLYHVKRTRDGASYKIVLGGGGVVQRKVREAQAEIEIPLLD